MNHETKQAVRLVTEGPRFRQAFNSLADLANANARAKGFYDCQDKIRASLPIFKPEQHTKAMREQLESNYDWLHSTAIQASIARMHSELSEALEAVRLGNHPDSHIPNFSGLEAELADVIIRILDISAEHKLDVAGAVVEKMMYNSSRPYKHGKNS